jgi:hypothetical protein
VVGFERGRRLDVDAVHARDKNGEAMIGVASWMPQASSGSLAGEKEEAALGLSMET